MKRRVIVHIGMHKTGSSSIQETLHNHLDDPEFHYANFSVRSSNHGGQVYSLFSQAPKKLLQHRVLKREKGDIQAQNAVIRERVVQGFKSSRAPNVIISGEGICNLEENGLIQFRRFLSHHFQEILIVAYVRPPRAYMESLFQQRVKGRLDHLDIAELYPHYRETFEKFDRVFGRENVHLWRFDPKVFPQDDVVLDFCTRLGIRLRAEKVLRVNEGMSKEALSALFAYRKFGPGYGVDNKAIRENKKLIGALLALGGSKLRFAPAAVRPVLEANRDDIRWIEARLGEPFAESLQESAEDVASGPDLLRIASSTVEALKLLIGRNFLPEGITGGSPREVAKLVHALRMKVTGEKAARKRRRPVEEMSTDEIIRRLRQTKPELLGKVPEKMVGPVIEEALGHLGRHVEAMEHGKFRVVDFGKFEVSYIGQVKEGKKVAVKRISFEPAESG